MAIVQKNTEETRLALIEQSSIHMMNLLHEIKTEIKENRQLLKDFRSETKIEFSKIWTKVEGLDHRINDNFKWVMGIMITLFSGLYATALGDMLLRLCKWI
jgi:hypothetical protein